MSVPGVLVLLLCCWSLSLADDAAALSDDVALADGDTDVNNVVATLLDRINSLDRRFLMEQDHLKARLHRQESLNQELTTRLLRQESLTQELSTRLLRQESLTQEQTTKLARQDGMLLQQGRLIQQLRSAFASHASATVSRASATASRASATASRASATVSRASATASRASATASRASATASHDDTRDVTGSKTSAPGSDSAVSGHNVAQRSDSGLNVTKRSDADHNIAKRSDDGGPLEAVVNQISQRVTEIGVELQALQNSDRQHDLALQDARTSTFVRWGSSTCSASSSLVYSGVVGGSWYGDSGAATNFLCLTLLPVFRQHAHPSWEASLFGAEYDTGDSHYDKDPVCAVCRAAFSTTVMVPGTDTCSPGWHLNYSGFLMAGNKGNAAGSEYICVDSTMESASRSDADEQGAQMTYTVTHCGSLPCDPYVNNKVVTCAVCSK